MVNEEIRRRVEAILADQLGPSFVGAEIIERPDSDGDPAIYIEARFEPSNAVPPSAVIVDTMVALRDSLLAIDDTRLPYVRPIYPDEPATGEAA